jgi:tripartite-type tricarboxylate transporter receptor subunit TctC
MFSAHARAWMAATIVVSTVSSATAQSAADFYKSKNVDLYIGYSVGGAYDLYARMLAKHMSKHIPGHPMVITKNMEGAGSLRLANWLYNVGPKDGSAFGIIGRGTGFDPLLGNKAAQFDATKFTWIGSANNEVSICVAWHTSGVTRFEDMLEKPLIVGGTSTSADTDQFPRITNGVLGTKMKVITGYPGGNEVGLAMERGEVQGVCGIGWTGIEILYPEWFAKGTVKPLVQLSVKGHRDLHSRKVPTTLEFARNDDERSVMELIYSQGVFGRPFVLPPGVPADRVAALRKAFMAAFADPRLLAEAKKMNFDIEPMSGEDMQALVTNLYATPANVVEKAKQALTAKPQR